jgi:hypothetical protein
VRALADLTRSTPGRCTINKAPWTRRYWPPSGSATPPPTSSPEAALTLVRGSADLIPTTQTLDENSPAIYCTTRNFAAIGPRVAASLGGNGYSPASASGGGVTGAANPYI